MQDVERNLSPVERQYRWCVATNEIGTHVVGGGVPKNIIERIRLRHVLCRLSNDDGQLDFVVGEMRLDRLGDFGDLNRRIGSGDGREGFVEKNRRAGYRTGDLPQYHKPANEHTHAGNAIFVSAYKKPTAQTDEKKLERKGRTA